MVARSACEFPAITWTCETGFSCVASCRDPFGDSNRPTGLTGSIELPGERGFIGTGPTGTSQWYCCAQYSLPEPRATNAISDLLEEAGP